MYLENIVYDGGDAQRLGRFWVDLLGLRVVTDEPDVLEARLTVEDGPWLDLCFTTVPEPVAPDPRLHLDLRGGAEQDAVVERALALGARRLDIGQGDVPWVVLADPEGNPFCVMEDREAYEGTGPVAALPLDSADPQRDRAFWGEITGWVDTDSGGLPALRHPSGRGPLLELCPEPAPKPAGAKNRLHLDVRLEAGDDVDTVVARMLDLGGREPAHDWGELPWRVLQDPSGNEVCVLPSRD